MSTPKGDQSFIDQFPEIISDEAWNLGVNPQGRALAKAIMGQARDAVTSTLMPEIKQELGDKELLQYTIIDTDHPAIDVVPTRTKEKWEEELKTVSDQDTAVYFILRNATLANLTAAAIRANDLNTSTEASEIRLAKSEREINTILANFLILQTLQTYYADRLHVAPASEKIDIDELTDDQAVKSFLITGNTWANRLFKKSTPEIQRFNVNMELMKAMEQSTNPIPVTILLGDAIAETVLLKKLGEGKITNIETIRKELQSSTQENRSMLSVLFYRNDQDTLQVLSEGLPMLEQGTNLRDHIIGIKDPSVRPSLRQLFLILNHLSDYTKQEHLNFDPITYVKERLEEK